jgi:hypothetical protein
VTFDEQALRAAFDTIEAPETLETRWRARVALAPDLDPASADVSAVPPVAWPEPPRRKPPREWRRVLAAAVAAAAVGLGLVGTITANREPEPDPDPNPVIVTTPNPPTTSGPPSQTGAPATVSSVPGPSGVASGAPGGPGPAGPPAPGTGPAGPAGPATPGQAIAPARGPLAEWPDATNTGPAGTRLGLHSGDLRIDKPGAIYADLRVNGTVYVNAPDVTLRRVMVVPSGDVGVVQGPQAQRLRIEDSQVTNPGRSVHGVRQEAPGLVVQRSDITANVAAVLAGSDATIVDSYLSEVRTTGNTSRITVRHNTIGASVALLDRDGPVTDVTIDHNRINGSAPAPRIYAPSSPSSHHLQVTGNQFGRQAGTGSIACSGWNGQAPGNIWAGNVWSDTSEPANP